MPDYITREQLAAMILEDKDKGADQSRFRVIDVRDSDFAGGNIVGALNVPSESFARSLDDLVRKTRHIPLVIIHCALSQSRPKGGKGRSRMKHPVSIGAAKRRANISKMYKEARALQKKPGDQITQVLVLQGGFYDFQVKYRDNPRLVEKWDKEIWECSY